MSKSKNELIEILRNTVNPDKNNLIYNNHGMLHHSGRKMSAIELGIYKSVFIYGYERSENMRESFRHFGTDDVLSALRKTDVGPEEFYNMCMLFLPHKNSNMVAVWMTYYAIMKGSTDAKIEESILDASDPIVKVTFALKYAYHCLNGRRFKRYDSYLNEWVLGKNWDKCNWSSYKINPFHFIYAYECLVDPCDNGNQQYANFLCNNAPESFFHVIPYVGRTRHTDERFDKQLYKLHLHGSGQYLNYIQLLGKLGIDVVDRMKNTIGEDISHMVGIESTDI